MKKFIAIFLFIFFFGINPVQAVDPVTTTEQSAAATEENHGEATAAASEAHTEAEEASTGVVGMFGLNWKLFLAQLINFAIILFVLWKWVFGPVTAGLSKRAEKIEKSLAEAEKINKDREDFDSWKKGEISQARVEASAIINQAKQEAEIVKTDILNQTKEEQNALTEQARNQLRVEKAAILTEAKTEIADLVVSATEKILKEKITAAKDKELIRNAIEQARS